MPVEILKCPNCNAPLNSADPVSKCPYCNSLIRVTESDQPDLPNQNFLEEVKQLLRENKKIEAIKVFREKTGLGLMEAKQAVEAIEKWDGTPGVPAQISQTITAITGESAEWMEQIVDLLRQGRKIEAIALFREKTHVGLGEAKMVVELMESKISSGTEPVIIQSRNEMPGETGDWLMQIQELLRRGKKIEAIKIYRQHTDVGLKEAKEEVERMEQGLGIGTISQVSAIEDLDSQSNKTGLRLMIIFIMAIVLLLCSAGMVFLFLAN